MKTAGASTVPKAPADLRARGRGRVFWRDVVSDFEPRRDELELLAEVCRQLDLCDVLRTAADVPVVDTPAGPKVHPALVELRQVRMELRRALGALGFPEPVGGELPDEVVSLRSQRARKAARARWDRAGGA